MELTPQSPRPRAPTITIDTSAVSAVSATKSVSRDSSLELPSISSLYVRESRPISPHNVSSSAHRKEVTILHSLQSQGYEADKTRVTVTILGKKVPSTMTYPLQNVDCASQMSTRLSTTPNYNMILISIQTYTSGPISMDDMAKRPLKPQQMRVSQSKEVAFQSVRKRSIRSLRSFAQSYYVFWDEWQILRRGCEPAKRMV